MLIDACKGAGTRALEEGKRALRTMHTRQLQHTFTCPTGLAGPVQGVAGFADAVLDTILAGAICGAVHVSTLRADLIGLCVLVPAFLTNIARAICIEKFVTLVADAGVDADGTGGGAGVVVLARTVSAVQFKQVLSTPGL